MNPEHGDPVSGLYLIVYDKENFRMVSYLIRW